MMRPARRAFLMIIKNERWLALLNELKNEEVMTNKWTTEDKKKLKQESERERKNVSEPIIKKGLERLDPTMTLIFSRSLQYFS